jgi:hypothetical protein
MKTEEAKTQHAKRLLRQTLKKDALIKVDLIRKKIEDESSVSYGSYEEGMLFIIDELDDIILNWHK